jgi:hypothetical protein
MTLPMGAELFGLGLIDLFSASAATQVSPESSETHDTAENVFSYA